MFWKTPGGSIWYKVLRQFGRLRLTTSSATRLYEFNNGLPRVQMLSPIVPLQDSKLSLSLNTHILRLYLEDSKCIPLLHYEMTALTRHYFQIRVTY